VHIGFLGHTFKSHSCGYLLRWLVAGLPEGTTVSYYNPGEDCNDHLTGWFASKGKLWNCAQSPVVDIAADIVADGVDVVVDIDSVTLYKTCAVVAALRANPKAPTTVSWMGFAPSGLCEYAIADGAVVPLGDEVQYRENILRMPYCYLAAGGFEMAVPEYRREDVGIPDDAFVYFYNQKPMKTHPETVRAIAQILAQQKDAHILIKAFREDAAKFWEPALNAPGRVHFLMPSLTEERARANLLLADVALDSWPYNGTLTTMECLWAGLPVVTRYGQGWSSRQGLSLCGQVIGASDTLDGYVDAAWLIRENLPIFRDALINARNESPLWNYRQFAADFVTLLEGIL